MGEFAHQSVISEISNLLYVEVKALQESSTNIEAIKTFLVKISYYLKSVALGSKLKKQNASIF